MRSRLARLELQELFAVAWRVVGVGVVDVVAVVTRGRDGGGDDVRGSLACCDLSVRVGGCYWHRWNRRSNRRAAIAAGGSFFSTRRHGMRTVALEKQWRRLFSTHARPMDGESVRISLIVRVRKKRIQGVENEVSDPKRGKKRKVKLVAREVYIYIGFSRFHPLGFLDTLPSIATREIPSWKGLRRSAHAHSLRGKRDGCRTCMTHAYTCAYIYIYIYISICACI